MEGKDGRTERATPKRRRERRMRGDLCVSHDVVAFVSLFFGLLGLRWAVPVIGGELTNLWIEINRLQVGPNILWDASRVQGWFKGGFVYVGGMLAPIVLPVTLAAVVANMAQTGPHLSMQALNPKFGALNPVAGFRRLFSIHSIYGMAMALLKASVIVATIYLVIRKQLLCITTLSSMSVGMFAAWLFKLLFTMSVTVTVLFAAIAAIDYVYRHYTYERGMMMTKKEVEDERKNQE